MLFTIFSVFYVLIAAAMIVLILLQRGAGADAGSGFGGGASATVFGARGSASFLTRATGALAALFFLLSLGMGIWLSHTGVPKPQADLGVMAGAAVPAVSTTAAAPSGAMPSAAVNPTQQPSSVPPANNSEVPQATAPAKPAPKAASTSGH